MVYRTHTSDAENLRVRIHDDQDAVVLDDGGNQERFVIKGTPQEIAAIGAWILTEAFNLRRDTGGNQVKVADVTGTVLDIELLDGTVRVFEPNAEEGDLGRMYVLDALGVDVLVRERADGTYVHVEDNAAIRKPLIVEVNNGGENPYGEEPAAS